MYSTCLFCHAPLGGNEAVERFPVGRRLAFDAARGRLWAVCGRCRRWNLSPLATRWEAVEECERLFRDARTRVSTENIGLARVAEGTELVRIGQAPRGEFAAWRWGDRIAGRARKAAAAGVLAGGAAGGVAFAAVTGVTAGAAVPLLFAGIYSIGLLQLGAFASPTAGSARFGSALHAVHGPDGERFLGPGEAIMRARLGPADEPGGWSVELRKGVYEKAASLWRPTGEARLTGSEAETAVRLVMARANARGARRRTVDDAVKRIEEAGDPRGYFARAEADARRMGWGYQELWGMPAPVRLALEMAANEERERRALEAELEVLEAEWKEAEEIAGIADRLVVPASVEKKLAKLRGRGRA